LAKYTRLEGNALLDPDLIMKTFEIPLRLDCGEEISNFRLAYKTYGTLNEDCSNAVLIFHALSGDSHVSGDRWIGGTRIQGWWSGAVGPDAIFDTNKFFVVCSNVLGGCSGSTGPSSIQEDGNACGLSFPMVSIRDMAAAQLRLIQELGLNQLHAIAGGSMGGMLALEFARLAKLRVPIKRAVVIAASPYSTPQQIAFHFAERNAIMSDPNWRNGFYDDAQKFDSTVGLGLARMIAHTTYCGAQNLLDRFGVIQERMQEPLREPNKPIERYLEDQGRKFIKRFDPNSFLYLTKAMDNFDIRDRCGSISSEFTDLDTEFLIMSLESDWLYPEYLSVEVAKGLEKQGVKVHYHHVEKTEYGHDSFVIQPELLSPDLDNFVSLY